MPPSIQTEIYVFMFRDALVKIKFLQVSSANKSKGRVEAFYRDILPKLVPIRMHQGQSIWKKEVYPSESIMFVMMLVYFLIKGKVERVGTGHTYTEGVMFGETDIIMNRVLYHITRVATNGRADSERASTHAQD